MLSSLSYSDRPALSIAQAARVLAPGGQLVAVTLHRHRHAAEVARYDHKNLGLEVDELAAMAQQSGLTVDLCAITSRERQPPQHQILTLHAHKAGVPA